MIMKKKNKSKIYTINNKNTKYPVNKTVTYVF